MKAWLLACAAVACASGALLDLAQLQQGRAAAPAAASATAPGASHNGSHGPQAMTASAPAGPLAARGRSLFLSSCAACHGLDAGGVPGRGPSLHGVGAMAADFYLQTGRMPLPSPRAQPMRASPAFPQRQISALVAYVATFGGPPVPLVRAGAGSLSDGMRLFSLDCAGCHSIQGQGGIVTGAVAPSLNLATPTEVAEAIRVGPFVMPRFGARQLSPAQVDSIARYVQRIRHPEDRGGWGIGRIGPIPEGMVAWLLAFAALLIIARLLGERLGSDESGPSGRGVAK